MTTKATAPTILEQVFAFGGKVLDSPEAVGKLVDAVHVAADAIRQVAASKTEQARIRADAEMEVARVHAVRDVLLQYLDKSFDERRKNFDALFGALDRAIETGQLDMVAKTLDSVVALAQSSPFKDLADAAKAHARLKDKTSDWEL